MSPRQVFDSSPGAGRVERPILHPDAALALRQFRSGAPDRQDVLTRTARFLARIEDAPYVTRKHVDAAAAIAEGNDLGDVAEALDAADEDDELGKAGAQKAPATVIEPAVKAVPKVTRLVPLAVSSAPATPGLWHGARLQTLLVSLSLAVMLVGGALWLWSPGHTDAGRTSPQSAAQGK